eukprot:CAMPEP_0202458310 /NCGR_PEP_ID=MMETSP1360-20130828/24452_1 /ASSEMBLY_ACC=CAM_ASM_000848 /TAXON_ID=515479 /ORGANISM="Licmophora paradoxa, Strain CCMP2313" /LENGTH=290 /DNA_ID=CAMNT_0049078801 /DNA_START=64 /DNA_END=936 /DNA_ORIENTATION=-
MYFQLVTLCIVANVWGTTAFSVQTPKSLTRQSTALASSSYDAALAAAAGGANPPPPPPSGPPGPEAVVATLQRTMDSLNHVTVQGGSLKTWSFPTPDLERILLSMKTNGKLMQANIELNQGPDNTPQRMDVKVNKGMLRPFKCVIETPEGNSALFLRNTGPLEFPFQAGVAGEMRGSTSLIGIYDMSYEEVLQGGGSIHNKELAPTVTMAKVVLKTDGRPLNARIELIQGPNSFKELIELYTEDGLVRPFVTIIETPGMGNVIRVENTAPMEFPLTVCVDPLELAPSGRK